MRLLVALLASAGAYTSPRPPIVAGNWKLNPSTVDAAVGLASAYAQPPPGRELVVFPPSCFLDEVASASMDHLALGAQDAFEQAESGAYTGAVSLPMLSSMDGVEYVLAGHSERRSLFGDDDAAIRSKVRATLDAGFKSMLCIGETKDEYEAGITDSICAIQLAKALEGVASSEMASVVIAYEPVWAIGTGLTCPPKVAQQVHAAIRARLAGAYDDATADATRILYGGSVTPETIDALMARPDVDGVLVGGASLDAEKFAAIADFHQGWWRTKGFMKKLLGR